MPAKFFLWKPASWMPFGEGRLNGDCHRPSFAQNADALVSSEAPEPILVQHRSASRSCQAFCAPLSSPRFRPKTSVSKSVILDIGASNENSASELVQFALMGKLYAQAVLEVKEPASIFSPMVQSPKKAHPNQRMPISYWPVLFPASWVTSKLAMLLMAPPTSSSPMALPAMSFKVM